MALVQDGELLGEAVLSQSGRRHARTLVAELQTLFVRAAKKPADCECVAVSIGPGSFTGLRVGAVCAKTLAYAVGAVAVGVDTLEAIAASLPADPGQVDVVMDAHRDELFVGRYVQERSPGSAGGRVWRRHEQIAIVPADEFIASYDPNVMVCGPAAAALRSRRDDLRIMETSGAPHAQQVALIGEREAAAGRVDDLWDLEPRYIRKSAAEEKADQAAR